MTNAQAEGRRAIEGLEIALKAKEALLEKKGEDLVLLDVREISSITDYYLIATGHTAPHLKALSQEVERALKKERVRCFRHSGTPESGWFVADYIDAVVHIFTSEMRGFYNLEQLWSDAPKVE